MVILSPIDPSVRPALTRESSNNNRKNALVQVSEGKTDLNNHQDANGRPDEEVAAESWENHRRLNKSIIVDLFQGQFKNTLKCLSCKYTSIKFDAFMFLSLPIPEKVFYFKKKIF